ncbi:hypothetical protein HMPREF2983_04260 [Prevotella sp. HMSC077E09]|jgi:hypothetical protein|uniref:hypothetical protein n=1 Tax=Prevotella sp. HMSC077E09 TaxID=1739487 RepID=UPI0008A25970|nr:MULTISPECIES: hypothetical protein [unclassified Prevotella]OFO78479.1 hypothetical protein HMPREF3018_06075 [Prevotella sp. HMSC077E08]OFP60744.1 hypothetical protein HMPREF2983_04260 [Prevotella sp. HMSC077E09]
MKNVLVDIFKDFGTFSKYAPGVETNMDLNDLLSSGITARKRVETIITAEVFNAIVGNPDDALIEALRSAIANMTMASQLIFDSIKRRKNQVDVYKYEIEGMKRSYMDNYYNAMDSIIQRLMSVEINSEDSSSPAAIWRKSRFYKIIDVCKIRTADEFDSIYPIDLSYFFFFRLLPLQKETLDERLSAYYDRLTDDNRERIEPILTLALVKKTVAKSLRRFDILEFPPTIRNLFDDSHASRSGKDEHDAALDLADRLDLEAEELISNADTLLATDASVDFCSNSAYNRPDDKIIMLP